MPGSYSRDEPSFERCQFPVYSEVPHREIRVDSTRALGQFASWFPQAGGTNMPGDGSSVVRIRKRTSRVALPVPFLCSKGQVIALDAADHAGFPSIVRSSHQGRFRRPQIHPCVLRGSCQEGSVALWEQLSKRRLRNRCTADHGTPWTRDGWRIARRDAESVVSIACRSQLLWSGIQLADRRRHFRSGLAASFRPT